MGYERIEMRVAGVLDAHGGDCQERDAKRWNAFVAAELASASVVRLRRKRRP